jgi:predicted TIM-barrel fold metal-dependent hydrolase
MIDSHAHLIADDPVRYPPAADCLQKPELSASMTVERLLGEMDRAQVARAVLVQRGSIYGFDNSYVCDSAARYPERLTAVGAIDGTSPDAAAAVQHWVTARAAGGIRLMELVKGSDLGWLASAHALAAWRQAHALGVPVCVHFFPWNRAAGLAALKEILRELPDVTVVIDHLSNMNTHVGPPTFGIDSLLRDVAAFARVFVKFTTIPLGRLDEAQIAAGPILASVVDLFGAQRIMWGSDIAQSAGTYQYMVGLARAAVASLDQYQQRQVLADTAQAVYGAKAGGIWRRINAMPRNEIAAERAITTK